jgi:hypothetical protein
MANPRGNDAHVLAYHESRSMKRSWRTTASGLIGALALVVVGNPSIIPARLHWIVVLAGIVASGGFAALGIAGKDAQVHSTLSEVANASPIANSTEKT